MVAPVIQANDQRIRRQRARLSQQDVADQFDPPISDTAISMYELSKRALPMGFTPEDYERALAQAIVAKSEAA